MSAAGRFFDWWGGELAALVPGGLARALAPRRPLLLAVDGPGGVALSLLAPGRPVRRLGTLDEIAPPRRARLARDIRRGRLRFVLGLAEGRSVRRLVRLPAAAEEDLAGVLAYEIDRLTPFRPEELHYDWRLAARRREAGRIEVELVLAPRAEIAPAFEEIAAAGLPAPARLDLLDAEGRPEGRNLLPPDDAPRGRLARRATPLLATAAALLALAWWLAAHDARQGELARLEAALADARRIARGLDAGAGPTGAEAAAALAALEAKETAPMLAAVLAAVTEVLPDDTHLERLSFETGGEAGASLDIAGLSRDASALPALFAADPRFAAPRFAAPITRAGEEGQERFLLRLGLAGALARGPERRAR